MKNNKDKADAEKSGERSTSSTTGAGRARPTRARTAGGKKLNPQVMASAEQKALEGLKQRTEEGHLKAGRTPPSQGVAAGRRSGGPVVLYEVYHLMPDRGDQKHQLICITHY